MAKRMIETSFTEEDVKIEGSLRPKCLTDYIGQTKVKENLKIYIEAAKLRKDALDHVLFYGPPGLGKTTLAGIIASEMGVNMKVTSGPAIEKPGEIAAILNNLQEGDLLFVDEIHRLNRQVEEVLCITFPVTSSTCSKPPAVRYTVTPITADAMIDCRADFTRERPPKGPIFRRNAKPSTSILNKPEIE